MDRMLYIAMNAAKQTMLAQGSNNNNLANASTTAFKADLQQFRSMPVYGEGNPSRVYSMSERPGIDLTPGSINRTGRELDVAIKGQGWIAVQAADGTEAYTRAGNLTISSGGLVVTGTGQMVLGSGGPIAIPQAEKIEIGVDGSISIRPVGQAASTLLQVDQIKLVNPDPKNLTKGEDGLIRTIDGEEAEPDVAVQLVSGALEGSNVNPVDSLVKMIELQRHYEMQVKVMSKADENDDAVTQIMRMA